MATDKLFNVFGVSKHNGEYKVRFATDVMRTKVLVKHGHEDIRLVDIEKSVTKYEGITAIKTRPEFADAAAQAAIAEYLEDKAPKAPKAKATKAGPAVSKAKAPAKAKASKTADAELEDAPF